MKSAVAYDISVFTLFVCNVITMPADSLVPCIASSSAIKISIVYNRRFFPPSGREFNYVLRISVKVLRDGAKGRYTCIVSFWNPAYKGLLTRYLLLLAIKPLKCGKSESQISLLHGFHQNYLTVYNLYDHFTIMHIWPFWGMDEYFHPTKYYGLVSLVCDNLWT